MTDFFSKLENFLFDLLGLALPGLVFLLIVATPLLLFDFSNICYELLQQSRLLSTFDLLSNQVSTIQSINPTYLIALVLLVSYILGHSIKIFSIIFYDFGRLIFDNSLIKFLNWLVSKILNKLNFDTSKFLYKYFEKFFAPIINTLKKIFTFQSPSYFSDNESLVKESVELINKKLGTKYPEVWYSLYKFSVVINSQEKLKSLAGFFLAKYNLYRSLSFLFILTFLYFQMFYSAAEPVLTAEAKNLKTLIQIISVVLWFTFHVKFKRYWTLCGNETLISLYYFLNRDLLRKPE